MPVHIFDFAVGKVFTETWTLQCKFQATVSLVLNVMPGNLLTEVAKLFTRATLISIKVAFF